MNRQLALLIMFAALPRTSPAQAAATSHAEWHDRAAHQAGWIVVAPDVRLHYLDWGGRGPTVLLLAGLGNTAHAFDDFAPGLIDRFHVIAVTRRGFGESSHPAAGYDRATLATDLAALIDSLRLGRAVLVGHSIAGEEMGRFAVMFPSRVAGLVYLDAAYDRTLFDSVISTLTTPAILQKLDSLPAHAPTAADTTPIEHYIAFVHHDRGVAIPEADIRARVAADGINEDVTIAARAMYATRESPPYRAIRFPALALYAQVDSLRDAEPWLRSDPAHQAEAETLIRILSEHVAFQREMFRREVPCGQVITIDGAHHWLFVSHRSQVLADVRAFLTSPRVTAAWSGQPSGC